MILKDKTIVVTGGSRGLGLGVVEALVDRGAKVTIVARGRDSLARVASRLGVATIAADVTDEATAHRIVADIRPDALILNAGAPPPMGRIDQIGWKDFSTVWESDVKAALYWVQAALRLPLDPGARVLIGSSGAAVTGSQMSGGYAGAKRMQWFIAKYAGLLSKDRALGIRVQAVAPRQMILGTGVGDMAAGAYAASMGITPEAFVARFGTPLPPRAFGDHVAAILEDASYENAVALGVGGDSGVTVMEEAAA
jgi:hypothetical protein